MTTDWGPEHALDHEVIVEALRGVGVEPERHRAYGSRNEWKGGDSVVVKYQAGVRERDAVAWLETLLRKHGFSPVRPHPMAYSQALTRRIGRDYG